MLTREFVLLIIVLAIFFITILTFPYWIYFYKLKNRLKTTSPDILTKYNLTDWGILSIFDRWGFYRVAGMVFSKDLDYLNDNQIKSSRIILQILIVLSFSSSIILILSFIAFGIIQYQGD